MGNESSSFVSDSSSMSTYLVICDDKKPNLFLKELILSWAIIGRFLFFPLKFSRKPAVRDVLLLLLNEADSGLKGCSDSTRLLFKISEHPLVFQNFWVAFTKFLLKRFEPDWFKCKPLPPRCLTFILLLFIVSIFSCKRCFVSCLTLICALPSSVLNVGVDIKTLHVDKLSFTRAFSYKTMSRTVRDGKFLTSFVPTCKIMFLGFFWILEIR